MKRKTLEGILGTIDGFENPKIQYEQYVTGTEIAADILLTMRDDGNLEDKLICDLGCGTGVLTIGPTLLGASLAVGFEFDDDAVKTATENAINLDINNVDFVQCDVTRQLQHFPKNYFDTVIMNPPFGTKKNQGIDMLFLEQALRLSEGVVYSLHKSTTREHVLKKANHLGASGTVLAQLRYDIPASYKFHKKQSVDIEVDFIRFSRL